MTDANMLWLQDLHTSEVTVVHADCKEMCKKMHRKLGKYIVTSTENKEKCNTR
jgi:hypothetical protein